MASGCTASTERAETLLIHGLAANLDLTWVREGLSQGDPGNWGLEGTSGPQFLGFNGPSYAATMVFAGNVSEISLDASRSNGSADGDGLELEAFCDGAPVDALTLSFGPINDWSTGTLAAECIDEVSLLGTGGGFHPYGVDNVRITFTPLDADGDGVPPEDDLCEGTEVPESLVPTAELGKNRYALTDGDDTFDTAEPAGKGPGRDYTLADTGGCSAEQIADRLGLGKGHYKFGVSGGVMKEWVKMVQEGAVAP